MLPLRCSCLVLCLLGMVACSWGFEEELNADLVVDLVAEYGQQHRERIESGVSRVNALWQPEDGSREEMAAFITENFIADQQQLDATFDRLAEVYETIAGNLHAIDRNLREPIDLDGGLILPIDNLLLRFSPYAHVGEDFFNNRIAFYVALNFPHYSLQQKLALGAEWDRRQWAYARLGDLYTTRVPADVSARISACTVESEGYAYNYYIHADRLLTADQQRLFPDNLRLIEHWGLRDEIRGRYTDPEGLPKQEMLFEVMLRIVDQTIPAQVVGSSDVFWQPGENRLLTQNGDTFQELEQAHVADTRYERLRRIFQAYTLPDSYHPGNPTVMDRVFNLDREIPEAEMERLLLSVISSPQVAQLGALIERRLGRPLRPFDIWYNGFKLAGAWSEAELDRITKQKYATAQAFEDDLPDILDRYGFSPESARFLSDRITVDDSRGSGHAMGAEMRSDKAHLRTRVSPTGLDYKGYNIALHELGHNIEQVLSLHGIDHYFLRGVPNNGFTEALAIMCQNRDLEILGLSESTPDILDLRALDTFLSVTQIGAVGVVEMRIWRWLYEHPDATAAQIKTAVMDIAARMWNEHFAPIFGQPDCPILAVYAHMLTNPTYLPNYSMGHIILFQIENYLKDKDFADEVERMFKLGSVTPDHWMQQAVGARISTDPLIERAAEILDRLLEFPDLTGPYLGQPVPGDEAEIFAPDLISLTGRYEYGLSFSADGSQCLYTAHGPDQNARLYHARLADGVWGWPQPVSLSNFTNPSEMEAFFTPDGRHIYFAPYSEGMDVRIWRVDFDGDTWSNPRPVGGTVADVPAFYPTCTLDGTLYYTNLAAGKVFTAEFDGEQVLAAGDAGITSGGHSFLDPDGQFVLLDDPGEDSFGARDIYVAFSDDNGGWTEPINLGPTVNTEFSETCASLSHDGKYLFFGRYNEEGGLSNFYWISSAIIENVRESVSGG